MTPPVKDYYCPPELYDVIYSDIRDDLPFWVAQAQAGSRAGGESGPVLELCCGTGRVLIPCLEAGVDIEGLFRRFSAEARTGYAQGFAPKPVIEDGDPPVWTAWKD